MKKLDWVHPNKALVQTGHRTFDRQCLSVHTGNVVTDTQFSSFVRHAQNCECNGFEFNHGELQRHDLEPFRRCKLVTREAEAYVVSRCEALQESVILYAFFYWVKGKRRMLGNVVTDNDHWVPKVFTWSGTRKGWDVLHWVLPYISEK